MGADRFLTIDVGGTFIKYSIMDQDYQIFDDGSLATCRDPNEFLEQLKKLVLHYKDQVEGAAVCIAGFIDPLTGVNSDYSVGLNFRSFNLKKELSETGEFPVILENDCNCAVIGEMTAGAARGMSDIALLTFGTGIGGAVALNGKLYRGRHNKAGEAGFMKFYCSDSKKSESMESIGATSVLVKEVSAALHHTVDGIYIFEHLNQEKINEIYSSWIQKAAVLTGNAAVLLDPEVVLIGGGICRQERFIHDLRSGIYQIFPHLEKYTEIKACETGNHAGRIGALFLLLEKYGRDN